jgi:hypothetical protein
MYNINASNPNYFILNKLRSIAFITAWGKLSMMYMILGWYVF